MNALKKRPVAIGLTVLICLLALVFGVHKSVSREARKVETMFTEGVDGSGFGIQGDLDDRAESAGVLCKLAAKYDGAAEETAAVQESLTALDIADGPTAKAAAPSTAIQTPPRDCAARQTASSSPSGSRYTSAAAPRTAPLRDSTHTRSPGSTGNGARAVTCTLWPTAPQPPQWPQSPVQALTRCTSRLTLPSGSRDPTVARCRIVRTPYCRRPSRSARPARCMARR